MSHNPQKQSAVIFGGNYKKLAHHLIAANSHMQTLSSSAIQQTISERAKREQELVRTYIMGYSLQ